MLRSSSLFRWLLSLLAAACCAAWIGPRASAQPLWELEAYDVRIYVAQEADPRLTELGWQELRRELDERIDALIGSAWEARLELAAPALARRAIGQIDSVAVEHLPAEALEADKVFLLTVSTTVAGHELRARELDVRTRQWGPVVARSVAQPPLVRPAALESLVEAFAPLAQIESAADKQATLRFRAARLPFRDAALEPLSAGDILRPILRFNDREGNLRGEPRVIPWTWLVVDTIGPDSTTCQLHTGLRSPLSSRRRGRSEQLALRVAASGEGSTLLLKSQLAEHERRLVGYEVFSYRPDSPETVLLGRTDRQGELWIPSQAEHPLKILAVKNGGQFLARLPFVPGVDRVAEAAVPDDDERLAVEGFITGMQEELVDLVARREVLSARIRARIAAGQLDEAQELLSQLRSLRTQQELSVLLAEQRRKIFSSDRLVQAKIDKLFRDTQEVLNRHLDPRRIDQVALELNQAREAQGGKAAGG